MNNLMKFFENKNKKKIERAVIWFIVASILFFVIPIVINRLYEIPAEVPIFAMSWEAKDVLSFYGSVLGAGATIIALSETIRFTQKSQQEERKLSIKPRLDSKWKDCSIKALDLPSRDIFAYIEYSETNIISSDQVPKELSRFIWLSKKLEQINKNSDNSADIYAAKVLKDKAKEKYLEYMKHHAMLLYTLYNYGANNAIDVKFEINGIVAIPPFCVSINEPKYLVLIFNDDMMGDGELDVNVKVTYTDICSTGKYEQQENFSVFKDNFEFISSQDFECKLSSPKEIIK